MRFRFLLTAKIQNNKDQQSVYRFLYQSQKVMRKERKNVYKVYKCNQNCQKLGFGMGGCMSWHTQSCAKGLKNVLFLIHLPNG